MYQREPEKNNWFHLDPQKLEQEQEEEQEDAILDSDIDPTSEEDLDESMDSGTSEEWGSWSVRWVPHTSKKCFCLLSAMSCLEYA